MVSYSYIIALKFPNSHTKQWSVLPAATLCTSSWPASLAKPHGIPVPHGKPSQPITTNCHWHSGSPVSEQDGIDPIESRHGRTTVLLKIPDSCHFVDLSHWIVNSPCHSWKMPLSAKLCQHFLLQNNQSFSSIFTATSCKNVPSKKSFKNVPPASSPRNGRLWCSTIPVFCAGLLCLKNQMVEGADILRKESHWDSHRGGVCYFKMLHLLICT